MPTSEFAPPSQEKQSASKNAAISAGVVADPEKMSVGDTAPTAAGSALIPIDFFGQASPCP